jgi:hypothetical protein
MIYGVVLAAGLYYGALGLGGDQVPAGRVAGFAAVMGLLFALEAVQRRWVPPGGSRRAVAMLLAARLGLFVAAAALDPSGESRVLFVLVPFAAYFAFGRTASLVLAGVSLVLLVAGFMLRVPHWYTQAAYLSDVLMFAVGLVLAIAMASVAVGEQAYAAQVARLSAATERRWRGRPGARRCALLGSPGPERRAPVSSGAARRRGAGGAAGDARRPHPRGRRSR